MQVGEKKSLLAKSQVWIGIVVVLSIQVGSIVWLGEKRPVEPRIAAPISELRVINSGVPGLMELLDPTIFALPHEEGFSGPGWLIPPVQEIQPFTWSEPPRWLDLPLTQLGAAFNGSLGTNRFEPLPGLGHPEPGLYFPVIAETHPFPERSALRLQGALASRRLLTGWDLPSWPRSDLVSNSVVQVIVDEEGLPFSVTLIERSGDKEADEQALKLARQAKFESIAHHAGSPSSGLAWGSLLFEWHTIPRPPETPDGRTP